MQMKILQDLDMNIMMQIISRRFPDYLVELRNKYALEHAAVVTITSENPDGFKGIDPLKMATYSKAMHEQAKTLL